MNNKNHFYLFGGIGEPDPLIEAFGVDERLFSASDISEFVQNNSEAKELYVHIKSNGGNAAEAYAMHDILTGCGKKIITIVEGTCWSAGTIVALAGNVRKKTTYSDYGIHNPWLKFDTGAGYNADELQLMIDAMRIEEDKLTGFYVAKTGVHKEVIIDLMKRNEKISNELLLQLHFITELEKPVAAFAYLKNKNENSVINMKHDLIKTIKNELAAIGAMIKGKQLMALALTTDSGDVLDIETAGEEPAVGDKCTIDGEPAPDGDYVIQDDGSTITVTNGEISAIAPKEPEAATKAQAMQKENSKLKKQLKEQGEALELLNKSVTELRAQIKSAYKPSERTQLFNKNITNGNKTIEQLKADREERLKTRRK